MNELQHHGIKGMKWGVRRRNPSGGGDGAAPKKLTKRQKKKAALEAVEASNKRAKAWRKDYTNRSKLSDAELKSKIERLRLENELNKLSSDAAATVKAKGDSKLKQLMNTKVPKISTDNEGNIKVDGMATVGKIVATAALEVALNQINKKKNAGETGPIIKKAAEKYSQTNPTQLLLDYKEN